MLNPNKTLRKVARVGLRRRPSAAMSVALVALFVALSGGAYAAVTIPDHSVGANQLKTFAVTNPKLANNAVGSRKIMPGAVGFYRVNRNEVQLRVNGTCASGQAISSVSVTGTVTCAAVAPNEADSGTGTAKTLTTSSASSCQLPAGRWRCVHGAGQPAHQGDTGGGRHQPRSRYGELHAGSRHEHQRDDDPVDDRLSDDGRPGCRRDAAADRRGSLERQRSGHQPELLVQHHRHDGSDRDGPADHDLRPVGEPADGHHDHDRGLAALLTRARPMGGPSSSLTG